MGGKNKDHINNLISELDVPLKHWFKADGANVDIKHYISIPVIALLQHVTHILNLAKNTSGYPVKNKSIEQTVADIVKQLVIIQERKK